MKNEYNFSRYSAIVERVIVAVFLVAIVWLVLK